MSERILTKHAPLIGPGGGRDLHARQVAALAAAQRVPGAGRADDVRLAVGAYLQAMAEDELEAVPGALADLLGLLDDAAAIAYERSMAATGAAARDWNGIARTIAGVLDQAQQAEALHPDGDPR